MTRHNAELAEELEVLKAILEEDIIINCSSASQEDSISITLHPLTGNNENKTKFVSLTLFVRLPNGYPSDKSPLIEVKNPRGLADTAVAVLIRQMEAKCSAFLGSPVLFELVEICREFLTMANAPHDCQCSICLFEIDLSTENEVGDEFCRTDCYHYFHSLCLGRYIQHTQFQNQDNFEQDGYGVAAKEDSQVFCPVCRSKMFPEKFDWKHYLNARAPLAQLKFPDCIVNSTKHERLDSVSDLEGKMKELFLKQKKQGGIIDLIQEEKRFLVVTQPTVPTVTRPQLPSSTTNTSKKKFHRVTSKGSEDRLNSTAAPSVMMGATVNSSKEEFKGGGCVRKHNNRRYYPSRRDKRRSHHESECKRQKSPL